MIHPIMSPAAQIVQENHEKSDISGESSAEPKQVKRRKRRKSKPEPKSVWLLCPDNFYPEMLPEDYEHLFPKLVYFADQIYYRRIVSHRYRPDVAVPLKTEYLRRNIGRDDFYDVLDMGLAIGLIDSDLKCADGQCRKYRIGERFGGHFSEVEVSDKKIVKSVLRQKRKYHQEKSQLDKLHTHLWRWVKKVKIEEVPEIVLRELASQAEKSPKESYSQMKQVINILQNHPQRDRLFKPDDYWRVHTVITALKRELRRYLRLDGEPLVEIDVKNSQVAILGYMAEYHGKEWARFEEGGGLESVIERSKNGGDGYFSPLITNTSSTSHHHSNLSPHTMAEMELRESIYLTENTTYIGYNVFSMAILAWKKKCHSGELYREIGKQVGFTGTKRKLKDAVFNVLYGDPNKWSKFHQAISEMYPPIMEFITWYKNQPWNIVEPKDKKKRGIKKGDRANFKALPRTIQRFEADLIIRKVCGRIMREDKQLQFLTIHDSLLVKKSDATYVEQIIREEFFKSGVPVQCAIKDYSKS